MFPKPSRARGQIDRYNAKQKRDLAKHRAKVAEKRREWDRWNQLRLAVYTRDGGLDRATGKRVYLETGCLPDLMQAHHVVYRSAGGQDEMSNLVCVSLETHAQIHDGLLDCEGDANGVLTFKAKDAKGHVTHVWTSEPAGTLREVS